MADSNDEYPTILGADAVFKGELQFEKGVRLLGKFEGEIHSSGQLLVADGAALVGDVKAGSIRVDGNVKGNLNAGERVQLTASAKVEGDLEASRLEVAEGAVLIGRCVVGVNGQTRPATKPASKPVEAVKPSAPPPGPPADKPKGNVPVAAGGKK
jgi:cytoskeletal protein CcmA (bactofilin family)